MDNERNLRERFSFPEMKSVFDDGLDGIPRLSMALSHKPRSAKSNLAAVTKVSEVSSLLGKAGTAGLGKAVEVLDMIGSSMTSLNLNSRFVSRGATKGNKITILSFEVANTIVKGANLMQCLSKDNIKHLKEVVLPSEGVQCLISKDMDELLRIAAADKREELKVFSGEVVRFGNLCIDPQWHNLDRYFERLGLELIPGKLLKAEAEIIMEQFKNLAQYTAELYLEVLALDSFEQDYFRLKQLEEDNPNAPPRGDSLTILRAELKNQRKLVRSLKKKSLWSKGFEEVVEQFVDIVHFLHMEIHNAFGSADVQTPVKSKRQKLGSAGLALHYANIITQIDTLVIQSSSVHPDARDALYQSLPPIIKSAMRSKLCSFHLKEELTVPEIKAEMEKTLHWLVPVAINTIKAHHVFGWVGEWANSRCEMNQNTSSQINPLRIETLHHADKETTESYILELVFWLHHLVSQSMAMNVGIRSTVKFAYGKGIQESTNRPNPPWPTPTSEELQKMLRDVSKRKLTPGISKSQEIDFDTTKRGLRKQYRLTRSSASSIG